jgi:hypothetical protein
MASRRHHFLPQFYLKNFADPNTDERIWRYPKEGGKPVAAGARDFGLEKDYHTLTRPDGTRDSDSIETMFATLEGEWAPVVRKILANEPISETEREIVITFAGAMLVRVPRQRDHIGATMGEMAKRVLQMDAFHKESFHKDFRRFQEETGDTSGVDPEAVRQAYLSEPFAVKTNPQVALRMSLWSMDTVVNCLMHMSWVFVRRNGRFRFITCDAPVFCVDPTLPPNAWHGAGLMSADMEVTLPLSPEVVAFGSHHPKRRTGINASPSMVRRLNQMRVDAAYRYIFADENSEALERFIIRNNDPTQPVRIK